MKGLKTLTAAVLGLSLLAGTAPASAGAAAYTHYVACGLSQNAKRSHKCDKARKKGAFFRSNIGNECRVRKGKKVRKILCVYYTVCVKFPNKRQALCAPKQVAEKGVLYVNKITSNIPGRHKVAWFVKGKRVGLFNFRVVG